MAKAKHYWSPSVTTDVVIFTIDEGELQVLLIKRSNQPFRGSWALPGGFLHKNETSHEAAIRILREKAGVKNVFIEQLYTFDHAGRDPRGAILTVTYFALVPKNKIKFAKDKSPETPAFFNVKKLPKLAFDHKQIVDYARKRLSYKLEYTNVVFSFLPKLFTLGQLQSTYEFILGRKLDKRNFRKRFLQVGLVKATSKIHSGSRQRPARLYRFVNDKIVELKRFI